jgi:hypothetical protein
MLSNFDQLAIQDSDIKKWINFWRNNIEQNNHGYYYEGNLDFVIPSWNENSLVDDVLSLFGGPAMIQIPGRIKRSDNHNLEISQDDKDSLLILEQQLHLEKISKLDMSLVDNSITCGNKFWDGLYHKIKNEINEQDIKFVMDHAFCNRELATNALINQNGNLVNAIMEIII